MPWTGDIVLHEHLSKCPSGDFASRMNRLAGVGIVRLTGRELTDQKRARLSRGKLTPFNERSSAVLFENVAAVEVAILIEVVVDRGMGGGEFL